MIRHVSTEQNNAVGKQLNLEGNLHWSKTQKERLIQLATDARCLNKLHWILKKPRKYTANKRVGKNRQTQVNILRFFRSSWISVGFPGKWYFGFYLFLSPCVFSSTDENDLIWLSLWKYFHTILLSYIFQVPACTIFPLDLVPSKPWVTYRFIHAISFLLLFHSISKKDAKMH